MRRTGFLAATLRDAWSDRLLHGIVAGYVVGAMLLARWLDRPGGLAPFLYVETWLTLTAVLLALVLALQALRGFAAHLARPLTGGLPAALRNIGGCLTPRTLAGCLLIGSLSVFFGTFTSVKSLLPAIVGDFSWDLALADLDAVLHGGVDPWRLLQPVLGSPAVGATIHSVYGWGWFLGLLVVTAWAALTERHAHLRRRFFLAYFMCWILLGNLLAGLFYSAGPAFFVQVTGSQRFAELVEQLDAVGGFVPHASDIQRHLWQLHEAGTAQLGSGISAFPSLHLGSATISALFLGAIDRRLGLLGGAFVMVILVGSVHLAWHYAIDGYVSIAAGLLIWKAAGLVADDRRVTRRPGIDATAEPALSN